VDEVTELDVYRPDGTIGVADMRVVAIEWEGEACILASLRDITERKRMEEDLRQKGEELERFNRDLIRSNKELEQFAYVASHDLQEPLRMVASYLQLLERRYNDKLDNDAREFIAYAVDGAKRMKHIINDLLAYSRIGSWTKPFAPTDCEVVLQETLTDLQIVIAENQAVISHDLLPTVRADAVQLRQLFQNLIGNALKFRSEEPPQIHISARLQPSENSRPGHVAQEWLFSVADNGIGLEPDFAQRIFAIFQRLHGKQAYPGTGLGLALCKKIVERHGGWIWLESDVGKGSTFYFTMPVVEGEAVGE
jgi:light-regulated signal transduction histidine kinase (bacteriophytochrome)